MRTYLIIGFMALVFVGCSSDSSSETTERGSGITGHAEAIELSEEEVLSRLETLFIQEAGMRPELAQCYTKFFEQEGLAEEIQSLGDLGQIQSEFTADQAKKYAACGPAVEVQETIPDLGDQ